MHAHHRGPRTGGRTRVGAATGGDEGGGARGPERAATAPALRVGDAERTAVRDELGVHYGAGRLDLAEYEERLAATLSARTAGELLPVLSDLPRVRTAAEVREATTRRRAWAVAALRGWLGLCVLLVGIWLLTTPGGYFWPVWPILGTGWCTVPGVVSALRGWEDEPVDARG